MNENQNVYTKYTGRFYYFRFFLICENLINFMTSEQKWQQKIGF